MQSCIFTIKIPKAITKNPKTAYGCRLSSDFDMKLAELSDKIFCPFWRREIYEDHRKTSKFTKITGRRRNSENYKLHSLRAQNHLITHTNSIWVNVCFDSITNFAVSVSFVFLKPKKHGNVSQVWNVFMWITLIIGSGMLMCLYSQEWFAIQNCPHNSVSNFHCSAITRKTFC